jgi:hypothetical protein
MISAADGGSQLGEASGTGINPAALLTRLFCAAGRLSTTLFLEPLIDISVRHVTDNPVFQHAHWHGPECTPGVGVAVSKPVVATLE